MCHHRLPLEFSSRLGWAIRTAFALALTLPLVIIQNRLPFSVPLTFLALIVAIVFPRPTLGATVHASIQGILGGIVSLCFVAPMSQLLALLPLEGGARAIALPFNVAAFVPLFLTFGAADSLGSKFGLALGFINLCKPIRSPTFGFQQQVELTFLTMGIGAVAALLAAVVPLPWLPGTALGQLNVRMASSAQLLTRSLRLVQTVIAGNGTAHIASLRQHAGALAKLSQQTEDLERAATTELALASLCCCCRTRGAARRLARRSELLRATSENLAAWRRTMSDRHGVRLTPTQMTMSRKVMPPMNASIALIVRIIAVHIGGAREEDMKEQLEIEIKGQQQQQQEGSAARRPHFGGGGSIGGIIIGGEERALDSMHAMRIESTSGGRPSSNSVSDVDVDDSAAESDAAAGFASDEGQHYVVDIDAAALDDRRGGGDSLSHRHRSRTSNRRSVDLTSASLAASLEEVLEQYAGARRDVLYLGAAEHGEDERAVEHLRRTASIFFFAELTRDVVAWLKETEAEEHADDMIGTDDTAAAKTAAAAQDDLRCEDVLNKVGCRTLACETLSLMCAGCFLGLQKVELQEAPPEAANVLCEAVRRCCVALCTKDRWSALQQPLKIGLALAIASLWFASPELYASSVRGVWMGITICFVLSHQAGASLVVCANRMLGTMLASVFSIFAHRLATATLPTHNSVYGTSFLLVLWVGGTSLWRGDSRIGYSALVAAFTPPALLFGPEAFAGEESSAFSELVLHRVEMTVLGIFVFLLVELSLWPVHLQALLRTSVVEWLRGSSGFLDDCGEIAQSALDEDGAVAAAQAKQRADGQTTPAATALDAILREQQELTEMKSASASLTKTLSGLESKVVSMRQWERLAEWEPTLGLRPTFPAHEYQQLLRLVTDFTAELRAVARGVAELPRCRVALASQQRLHAYCMPISVTLRAASGATASAAGTIERHLHEKRCSSACCWQHQSPAAVTLSGPRSSRSSRSRRSSESSQGSNANGGDGTEGDGAASTKKQGPASASTMRRSGSGIFVGSSPTLTAMQETAEAETTELVGFILAEAHSIEATTGLLDLKLAATKLAESYASQFHRAFPKHGESRDSSIRIDPLQMMDGESLLRISATLFSLHHIARTGVQLGHCLQLVLDRELA